MLVQIDEYTTINLDQVVVIFKRDKTEDEDAAFLFFLADGNRVRARFEDAHLRDLALTKIMTDYQGDCKYCDITEYVKKG